MYSRAGHTFSVKQNQEKITSGFDSLAVFSITTHLYLAILGWKNPQVYADHWVWSCSSETLLIKTGGQLNSIHIVCQFLSIGSFSKCLQWLGLNPGIRNSIQASHMSVRDVSHHSCLLGFALEGSWNQEPKVGIEPRHFGVGSGHLNQQAQHLLQQVFNQIIVIVSRYSVCVSLNLQDHAWRFPVTYSP